MLEHLKAQLMGELRDAEWCEKVIHPFRGDRYQNWCVSLYLPVPLDAAEKTPQAALQRYIEEQWGIEKTDPIAPPKDPKLLAQMLHDASEVVARNGFEPGEVPTIAPLARLLGHAHAVLLEQVQENERLRGIVPKVVEDLNDGLCDEVQALREVLGRLADERLSASEMRQLAQHGLSRSIESASAQETPMADAEDGKLVVHRAISVKLRMSASDWQLYAGEPGADEAAQALNASFKALVATSRSADEVERGMHKLMHAHRKLGAFDTEPRAVLDGLLRKVYGITDDEDDVSSERSGLGLSDRPR